MSQPESLHLPPSPPSSIKMDPAITDGSCGNPSSPPARSTGGPFLTTSVITASPKSLASEPYLSQPVANSPYLSATASQSYSCYPAISPGVWTAESSPQPLAEQSHSDRSSSTMSAVAVQYDPSFSMGPRSAFTWPGPVESHSPASSIMSQGFSMGPGSDPSLTPPPSTRSLTSSPPRLSLTTEQRELKRHHEKARREQRLMTRMRRTSSNSYMATPPPSMPLPEVSSTMSMSVYTTAPEATSTMSTSPYMSSYSSPVDEQHAPVYPTSYPHNMSANYNLPMDYAPVYAGSNHYSSRPTSVPVGQDVGLMYQVPAVMATGGANTHEGGHVRVVQSRPKPRCWEHGCNGRQFSTFSNLLRHQREKSGQAAKASCPNCGAEFTRTTARNGHLLHDKCKGRRSNN